VASSPSPYGTNDCLKKSGSASPALVERAWNVCLDAFRAAIKMWDEEEQRVRNKFCVELGENSAETSEILKTAFGNDCSSHARKFEWFTKFKEGRNSGDDDPRPRRTSTSRNDLSATLV